MLLSRIHLNPRVREARRDLADPYQLHATLCRAFSPPDTLCSPGAFLWRLEPETDRAGYPRVLVQSDEEPQWGRISVARYVESADPPIDLKERLSLRNLALRERFRFRLRANPAVKRNGRRQGLLHLADQEKWLLRKSEQHGFALPVSSEPDAKGPEDPPARVGVRVSQERMLRGKQHRGNPIWVFSVLFDGVLSVTDPERFTEAIHTGIGPGKVMGLGLLSVVPMA